VDEIFQIVESFTTFTYALQAVREYAKRREGKTEPASPESVALDGGRRIKKEEIRSGGCC
jgi:hypothetical protein